MISSNNSIISNNDIISNDYGIDTSGNNTHIIDNVITNNSFGLRLQNSANTNIQNNLISNNVNRLNTTTQDGYGIQFDANTNSTTIYNNILEGNTVGINLRNYLLVGTTVTNAKGSDNFVFANNFLNVGTNVNIEYQYPYAEAYSQLKQEVHPNSIINGTDIVSWDNSTVGNFWSDYDGNGSYVIDENNIDHYPLSKPVVIPTASQTPNFLTESWFLPLIISMVITAVVTISFLLFRRRRKTTKLNQ